ncbi:hypothetical protein LBBP_00843 [Leptospira borgpetersenii serovar Ballum]|uniref:Uncharacterized protein n=1 Tax=Leptospira borgpetersenii serovar Ballum TaxID=280505 RepID=A0A0S2INZ0_LEPBO|nr:hypothetical protein LBBP_00843 [Leptospira borgpetersenii serovar Ballum]
METPTYFFTGNFWFSENANAPAIAQRRVVAKKRGPAPFCWVLSVGIFRDRKLRVFL